MGGEFLHDGVSEDDGEIVVTYSVVRDGEIVEEETMGVNVPPDTEVYTDHWITDEVIER